MSLGLPKDYIPYEGTQKAFSTLSMRFEPLIADRRAKDEKVKIVRYIENRELKKLNKIQSNVKIDRETALKIKEVLYYSNLYGFKASIARETGFSASKVESMVKADLSKLKQQSLIDWLDIVQAFDKIRPRFDKLKKKKEWLHEYCARYDCTPTFVIEATRKSSVSLIRVYGILGSCNYIKGRERYAELVEQAVKEFDTLTKDLNTEDKAQISKFLGKGSRYLSNRVDRLKAYKQPYDKYRLVTVRELRNLNRKIKEYHEIHKAK